MAALLATFGEIYFSQRIAKLSKASGFKPKQKQVDENLN
jgi:hypothetical protein